MIETVNIYCDESSHLENDKSSIMGLGALSCPDIEKRNVSFSIHAIKEKHNLPKSFEIKWTKVSNSKLDFYLDIIDYFFETPFLGFRSVIIDKNQLNHDLVKSNHDEFYYKMNFYLLRQLLDTTKSYRIFLDKKDTNGRKKIRKLHEVLCNDNYDFKQEIIKTVQEVVSNQVILVQLCDLLLGAVCYINRDLASSPGKLEVVKRIQQRSSYSLVKSTFPSEYKMNTFIWETSKKNGL
ncbi:MAG: DUF3800 domain-containing protein [Bacteroidota bacterium]